MFQAAGDGRISLIAGGAIVASIALMAGVASVLPSAPGGPAATASPSARVTPFVEPTPFPLPPGATAIALQTAPPGGPVAGVPQTCAMALSEAVRITRGPAGAGAVSADSGAPVPLAWPRGFSARLIGGRAEIVSPGGDVIARDGDILVGLNGPVICSVTGYVAPAQPQSSPRPSPPPNAPQVR